MPEWFWPLEQMKIVAKEMRCSVRAAMKLPVDVIDKALMAADAKAQYRKFLLEEARKK